MHGQERFTRFFTYLNMFAFSMLVLVLGGNYLLLFLGWEGVGLCSYLLISFWFEKPSAARAGKKAFVTNRVGDFGFMLAMFLIFSHLGTLELPAALAGAEQLSAATATAVALLLYVGAAGKSAQGPLFVWLPDAMEGPTPVSALIHAATMVTAGVYLLVRSHPFLEQAPAAGDVVAWVGGITALVAATIALVNFDIKRVLAYSTISQLGYMFLAVGVGAYTAAIFHMVTHAFFKALMFLGAGSVMHGMEDEQDMRWMGGLKKFMPDHRHDLHRRVAGHRRGHPVRRLLVEGRDPRRRLGHRDREGPPGAVGHRRPHGLPHRLLHDPPGAPRLLR